MNKTDIGELIGLTLKSVVGAERYSDEVRFQAEDGRAFRLFHLVDSGSEVVYVDEIHGDIEDLIGSPILRAEENSTKSPTKEPSWTWTFYRLATIKGSVQIKWYGGSEYGHYSESVDFEELLS